MRKLVYAEVTARFDRQRNTGRRFFNVVFAQLPSLLIARVYATPTKRYVIAKGPSTCYKTMYVGCHGTYTAVRDFDDNIHLAP